MKRILLIFTLLVNCTPPKDSSLRVPKQLANFSLQTQIQGQDAIDYIQHLHRESISLVRGVIAFYGKDKEITLYVSQVENSERAKSLLHEMIKKMEQSKGPFLSPRRVAIEDFKISPIYVTYGLEQGHFFFQRGKTLFWLSSIPQSAYDALRDLEDFILR